MSFVLVGRKAESATSAKRMQSPTQSLRVSQPHDALEQEADRVADAVMRGSRGPQWSISKLSSEAELHRQPTGPPQQPAVSPQSTDPRSIWGKVLSALADEFMQKTDVGKNFMKRQDAIHHDTAVTAVLDFLSSFGMRPVLEWRRGKLIGMGITVSSRSKGDANKPASSGGVKGSEAGTASWDPTRNMRYEPGSLQDLEQQQKRKDFLEWATRRAGLTPKIFQFLSRDQSAPKTELTMPEWPNPFAPKMPSLFDQQLELKLLPMEPDAAKKKEEPAPVQRKAEADDKDAVSVPAPQALPRSGGRPLDRQMRTFMESRFGFDFSKVRVHTDGEAAAAAKGVNAVAYTIGNNIMFGAGHYEPETTEGRKLIAHELVHTVQQSALLCGGEAHGAGSAITLASRPKVKSDVAGPSGMVPLLDGLVANRSYAPPVQAQRQAGGGGQMEVKDNPVAAIDPSGFQRQAISPDPEDFADPFQFHQAMTQMMRIPLYESMERWELVHHPADTTVSEEEQQTSLTGTARGPARIDWGRVLMAERMAYAMSLLVQKHGFSQAAAAGIVGNLRAEGRLIPNIVEGGTDRNPMVAQDTEGRRRQLSAQEAVVGRPLQGIGIAQWTAGINRRTHREDWSRRTGLWEHWPCGPPLSSMNHAVQNLYSMRAQIDYVVHELDPKGKFRGLANFLSKRDLTVAQASDAVLQGFERPRVPNFADRRGFALEASTAFDRALHPAAPQPHPAPQRHHPGRMRNLPRMP